MEDPHQQPVVLLDLLERGIGPHAEHAVVVGLVRQQHLLDEEARRLPDFRGGDEGLAVQALGRRLGAAGQAQQPADALGQLGAAVQQVGEPSRGLVEGDGQRDAVGRAAAHAGRRSRRCASASPYW